MHDITEAVVRLRTKFPTGYTAQANGDWLSQDEADQLLKQDAEIVPYLEREAPRLMREALATLPQSRSGHKIDYGSFQPPLSTFETGETQPRQAAVEEADRSEPSSVSSSDALAQKHGLCPSEVVPDQDESQEALSNVEKITDSEPCNAEELVKSDDLKRKFREAKAKERLRQPPGKKPV